MCFIKQNLKKGLMNMKLLPEDKFFIEDENDGSLVLINEINLDPNMIKNMYMIMKGTRFYVDYEIDEIDKDVNEVEVSVSFNIEGIFSKDD